MDTVTNLENTHDLFQIPNRQHGPHNRREQGKHAIRIRSGEHRVSCVRARHTRVGR